MTPAPPGPGWRDWIASIHDVTRASPYAYDLVEAWRSQWPEPEVLHLRSLPPWFNVADLWWRPLPTPRLEPEAMSRR